MKRSAFSPLLILVALMGGVWSGCDSESGQLRPNIEPNTRISAGPPEMSDTGFSVNLFWFGWDEDGFVDHYEIAWQSPDNWVTPIFSNDSLFSVVVAETCCVEPLPEFGVPLPDSVYSQFHTFYVRAVDNRGVPDASPASRSFNAKTIAPYTEINFGPAQVGEWGTDVVLKWEGKDDDGFVASYKFALVTLDDWRTDFDITNEDSTPPSAGQVVAWLDTLTYQPLPGQGQYDFTKEIWQTTEFDTVLFTSLPPTNLNPADQYLFAVRAIDNAGAEEVVLGTNDNTRRFNVTTLLDGPSITLVSNIAGTWQSGGTVETREVFAGQGLRFNWTGRPGPSQTAVAGFSYAVDDTTDWSPFSLNTLEWPPQPLDPDDPEELWFPEEGSHAFFVRAIDLGGFIRVLGAQLRVFNGPRFCDANQRTILVVLDTDLSSLTTDSIWPTSYRAIERALIEGYFDGYNFQVHETKGSLDPKVSLMNCASSIFWFHSADIAGNDGSILDRFHRAPPNPLPSYVSAGGNLFLCGLQPSVALGYFEDVNLQNPRIENHPIIFENTLDDPDLVPHWAATHLGISRVVDTVPNTSPTSLAPLRLRVARSQVPDYPDLRFDALTWPQGPIVRGFGYYDREVQPLVGDPRFRDAEVIYTANNDGVSIGVRKLTSPGINGNTVFLGLHPYFIDRPAFRELILAVLANFGEDPIPPGGSPALSVR